MIDVVFLLLIFFMLVSRFGAEDAIPLRIAGADVAYSGPPRLVDVGTVDLRLNGVAMEPRTLLLDLVRLTTSGEDAVVLRPDPETSLQRLIDVMEVFQQAGFGNLAIVEAAP